MMTAKIMAIAEVSTVPMIMVNKPYWLGAVPSVGFQPTPVIRLRPCWWKAGRDLKKIEPTNQKAMAAKRVLRTMSVHS